jgi:hypothetical protein
MLRLFTECYIKRAHSQCVDVVAISKLASAEDHRLEADMRVVVGMKYLEYSWLG